MDSYNVLDIMNISTIEELDRDFNQWELLPYDLRKKSDDVCIQKYGCNNIQLYNIIKAKMLQQDNGTVFESAVDKKVFISKLKYMLEGFNTGDQSKQEILGYIKNGSVNDRLAKIQLSKDYMKFEDDWMIICDFIDDNHPDYTLADLNAMFDKYNTLNPEHRRLSDTYSIAIWGRPVFGMYSYMKQKFETKEAEQEDIEEFIPDAKDQAINNYTQTITTESGDDLQLLIRKLDCYNKSSERSLYESAVLEQFGDKIKVGKKTYRQDLPGVVPFLTYTEYLHNAKGLDQKKINRVDPFSYVFNSKATAKSLEEMYNNGEKDKLLELGWNPEVRPTKEAIEFAREKQIKWFDENKLFDITDISRFDFLGEANIEDSTSSLVPLYLVVACDKLSREDIRKQVAGYLKFKSLKDYNHIGLSLESNLENIYTFDNKSEIPTKLKDDDDDEKDKSDDNKLLGLKVESINDYEKSSIVFVMAFFVKGSVKRTIKTSLKNYLVMQDTSPYNFDNVMSIVKNKAVDRSLIPAIVIGQFLDSIFKISNIYDNIGKQKIGAGMNQFGGRFYVMFSGPIKDYKENKVKKKIDGLKKIGTFSSLNFFGANNTVDENIKPEEYGYYTFDTYLKKYTNEAVNNVVVAIRDILNPNNNEFRWIPDEVVLSKEEILQKIQDINNDCDTMNDKDYSIIAHRLQKLKVDRSVLLNIIKSMKDIDEQLIITVNGLLSKVDSVIRYYDNYLKQFNITPNTQDQNNKIVIHDVSEKFKFSADNIRFDN